MNDLAQHVFSSAVSPGRADSLAPLVGELIMVMSPHSIHRTNQQTPCYLERDIGHISLSSDIHFIDSNHRTATDHRRRGTLDLSYHAYSIRAQNDGLTS